MNIRGLMLLIITNVGLINRTMYSILVMVAIITTMPVTPIFRLSLKDKTIKSIRRITVR